MGILRVLLVACLTISALAADSAKSIFRDLADQARDTPAWKIEFEHRFVWTMAGDTTVQTGTLITGPDGCFLIEAGASRILSDGISLWRWDLGGFQVLQESPGASEDVILPQQFFLDLDERFEAGELNYLEKKLARLDLVSRSDSEFMSNVQLMVEKRDRHWLPLSLSFIDLGLNLNEYRVIERQALSEDDPLLQHAFDFVLPEGMELIDLRQPEQRP